MMSANYEFKNPKKIKSRFLIPKKASSILIVDDDPDFLHLVYEHVSKIECAEIDVAETCDEAVSKLTNRHFSLVICDWSLATRTGPEVFHLADPLLLTTREPNGKIPVMFMSGSEKVACTQNLSAYKNFEPVTFIIKNLGAKMIRIMAENVLRYRNSSPSERGNFGTSRYYQA